MTLSASFQKINNQVFLKGEYQAAGIYLGQLALSNLPASDLIDHATALVTQVLQVEICLFGELMEDKLSLLFRSVSSGDDEASAIMLLPLDPDSLEGRTFSSPNPILAENLEDESRFKTIGLIRDRGARSGVSVRVGTLEQPYGIIEAFSRQVQYFSQSDVYFLQSIANIIGMVLCQKPAKQQPSTHLQDRSSIRSGQLEWDRQELKNRLIESREKERLRLAQDLHDIPIQDLYGLIYQFDDLRDVLHDPEGEKLLNECDHTLHKVVNSLRTICRELRPPSLSPFGLEVAIRDHVEKFRDQNPDISVHLDLIPDKQALSDSLRLTLFRIYQQAIHNVARHAEATEVHVRFRWDENTILLEVEDNGKGFEVPKHWMELVDQEHFGLLGIAERVESVRGKLEILSALERGTLIRAVIPHA